MKDVHKWTSLFYGNAVSIKILFLQVIEIMSVMTNEAVKINVK